MEEKIIIGVRDVNGNRKNFGFQSRYEVLQWAEDELSEDDEILVVAQGSLCLYSALSSPNPLTADDLTGFFG